MGTRLHHALKTLCFNTDWRYAVFWNLERRTRLTLTWEDAYYDNCDKCCYLKFPQIRSNLCDRHLHDPLGLAVVKMSYQVYSLGEGVIGQVAVTGKHMWIFADKHVIDSYLPFEHSDGWHTQFSAGIRTVAVVAVIPHGVVQLGSLNKIPENLETVNHIRDLIFAPKELSVVCNPRNIYCTVRSCTCRSDMSTTRPASGEFSDRHHLSCVSNKDKNVFRALTFRPIENPDHRSYIVPLSANLPQNVAEVVNKDEELASLGCGDDEGAILLESRSECFLLETQKPQTRFPSHRLCHTGTSGLGNHEVDLADPDAASSKKFFNKDGTCNVIFPRTDFGADITYLQADLLDSSVFNNQTAMWRIQSDTENTVFQAESNKMDAMDMTLKFSAGCELYEVLGSVFQKQSYYDWEAEKTEFETTIEIPEGLDCSSLLTADSGSEQLLEAVVANVRCGVIGAQSEKSFCESVKSQLTIEEMRQPISSKVTGGSSGDLCDQSFLETEALCLSSEACGMSSSSKGFSSRSQSMFSGKLNSALEAGKINKKRVRPGESGRPRPRDRQLIQDRIKELRELVPNGSKCSIDSLLERTIKHMMFMQSITKHAEKLNKCTNSKMHDKETAVRGFPSYDHGSTWAVEVGSLMKVCPIMVENINKSGQILIEMLREECSHFLVIAEAIRSLSLTILEGGTETSGKKTLMCFVVEGQNNRNMHRMDILWSLVQILQSKTTI